MMANGSPVALLRRNGAAGSSGNAATVFTAFSDDKAVSTAPNAVRISTPVELIRRNGSAGATGNAANFFCICADDNATDTLQHIHGDAMNNAVSDQKPRGGIAG